MIKLTLSELCSAIDGELVAKSSSAEQQIISQIVTDSRALNSKEVFLALKGPNFDGHRFIKQVEDLGCCAVIVDHFVDENQGEGISIPQIVVKDTRIALGKIAAYVKQQVAPKTVGITGSSGKQQ